MRLPVSLFAFALSMTALAVACGGGGAEPGASSGASASSGSSGTSGGGSSSSSSSSSSSASSSGQPIEPGKPGAACGAASECDDGVCRESVCRAPRADDGVKNGNETGIDCGSSVAGENTSAPKCGTSGACVAAVDCVSAHCEALVCVAPTSTDGIKNGNESSIDCGASGVGQDTAAPKCVDASTCSVAADCLSGVCNGTCQQPTKSDGVKNGNETDVDCGSLPPEDGVTDTQAPPCDDRLACAADADCESLVCAEMICQEPTCIDAKKNGTETDLNCGGLGCSPCADTKTCLVGGDCQSSVCNVTCQTPTKTDGAKNGKETDIDCGSSGAGAVDTGAPVCRNARACTVDTDCFSGKCTNDVCAVPTSGDGVKNGNETGVDCGTGPTVQDPFYGATTNTGAGKCANDVTCLGDDDCINNVCKAGLCKPKLEGYGDLRQNGDETAIDCGGSEARGAGTAPQTRRCVADDVCNEDEDCKSNACQAGRCLLARSCGMHHGGDTCGTGDETWPASAAEPGPNTTFKKHESCCESIRVERPAASGGAYRLDKYQITAGRMRRFLETLANGPNLDDANVRAWVDAVARGGNDKVMAAAQLPAAHDGMYPTGWNTPVAGNNCGQNGTTPCNYGWAAHLGGFRYTQEPGGANGYGCQMNASGYGSRTFYLPDAVAGTASKYRDLNGETQHLVSKDRLDQKALSCVDYVMLSAFCAWDGGRLELKTEHAYAYDQGDGRAWPWGAENPMGFTGDTSGQPQGANFTPGAPPNPSAAQISRFLRSNVSWNYANMIVQDRYYFLPAFRAERENLEPTDSARDQSFAVAPPGRYPAGAGPFGHRDLSGNMMEITASGGYQWSKNGSFEGFTHSSQTNGGENGFSFSERAKYGRATGRCARPLDGYPAQLIPKR